MASRTVLAHAPSRPGRRVLLATGAALLTAPAFVRAADPGIAANSITLGQSIALQGGRNAYAAEVQAGIGLMLDELNRAGGIGGRRILLRTLDDENDAKKAEANASRLLDEGVFMLFGSLEGGPSTAVMNVAVERKVPFFGPMAGSPGFRRPHQPLVFPVRAEHRQEFRELIEHGQRIGLKRVLLFHSDSGVGQEHLTNVQRIASDLGITSAGGVAFKSDISDPQLVGALDTIIERGADLVLNHGSAGIYERLIRRARQAGSRIAFWGVNSGSVPLAAKLGPLAHGMVFAQIVPNPASGKTALAREYQQRLAANLPGTSPSHGSLEGYMTAKALVAALRTAGNPPGRAGLLKGLANFDLDLGGVTLRYRPGDHVGCTYVDLALVGRDGRFVQ
jgi:branched-chain amino acid transport system substrate-binding protein